VQFPRLLRCVASGARAWCRTGWPHGRRASNGGQAPARRGAGRGSRLRPRMIRPLIVGLTLLLGACQSAPAPPLMSPIEATRSYGYAERQLAPDRWEVTYVGPIRNTSRFPGPREADEAAARAQVFDLMLWRAAQIAQHEGYHGFRVEQTRS